MKIIINCSKNITFLKAQIQSLNNKYKQHNFNQMIKFKKPNKPQINVKHLNSKNSKFNYNMIRYLLNNKMPCLIKKKEKFKPFLSKKSIFF